MDKIIIKGNPESFNLSVNIQEILKSLTGVLVDYWLITYIYGISNSDFDMLEFEREINSSGKKVSTEELMKICTNFRELYDITIAGYSGNIKSIEIELLDGVEWEVFTIDKSAVKKLLALEGSSVVLQKC